MKSLKVQLFSFASIKSQTDTNVDSAHTKKLSHTGFMRDIWIYVTSSMGHCGYPLSPLSMASVLQKAVRWSFPSLGMVASMSEQKILRRSIHLLMQPFPIWAGCKWKHDSWLHSRCFCLIICLSVLLHPLRPNNPGLFGHLETSERQTGFTEGV